MREDRQSVAAAQGGAGGGGRGRHGSALSACRAFPAEALQAACGSRPGSRPARLAAAQIGYELERRRTAAYITDAIRRVSELASGLTRNQMPSNGLWVRIPCPPPLFLPLTATTTFWPQPRRSMTSGSFDRTSPIRREALPESRSSTSDPTTSARQPEASSGTRSSSASQ